MSFKTGTALIAVGVIPILGGLVCTPAAFREPLDASVFGLGVCLFSVGMMITASGIYLNARALSKEAGVEAVIAAKRVRGGCELCATENPVIYCKTHQLHMCGACLAQHYDVRSCAYIPTQRRTLAGSSKGMAKARGV